jgi:hypothetical protein
MIFQNFGFNQNYPVVSGGGNDPDAQAFINATGISGSEATAINQLVLDLKSYGLYSKLDAAYPLVGGTADSTKYNLIDPQDTNAAFRITWAGGITFASTGVTGNGTTGIGNTNYVPSTHLATSNMHLSAYRRTVGNTNSYDLGGSNFPASGGSTPENMLAQFGNTLYGAFGAVVPAPYVSVTETGKIGFFVSNNLANTTAVYKNGTSVVSSSRTFGKCVRSLGVLGQFNSNGIADPSSKSYAWFSIGEGLTGTEVGNFNTTIQAFQTTLGRNV